jgi:ADP-ribose diphosphatase
MKKWMTQKSEIILDNKWIKVRRDTCSLPSGKTIDDYYLWVGNDFAMVFGLTTDDQVVLVKQYKHGAQDIVIELPAGLVNDSDSDPQSAAARELKEETGYEAENFIHLANVLTSSAKATTVAHLYLATGLAQVANPKLDSQESIEHFAVSQPELIQMIATGRIRDVNSIATSFLALQKLGRLALK